MRIHTVVHGDTIFKIARKYAVQPTKIIEDNGLEGDRLTVGQELLILTPTRTVTVRGGDTLASLARRFGVRRSSLLSNNPALSGEQRLRPGHILSVKFDTPPGGASSALGILSRGAGERKLKQTLPYLTYVVLDAYSITDEGFKRRFDPSSANHICKRAGKISLLGFTDMTRGKFLLGENPYEALEQMIELAMSDGFGGIRISATHAALDYPDLMASFLMEARKRLIGCDLILFADNGHYGYDSAELSDGVILNPWIESEELCSTLADERLHKYADRSAGEKTFVWLPTFAKAKDAELRVYDAYRLAERVGAEICRRNDLMSYFDYKRYIKGTGEDIRVIIPSLSMVKAKLDKIHELGFIGIAFDIEGAPIWLLSMFNSYFSRADYSLLFGEQ